MTSLPVDLAGRTLAHYRILEKLGAGGMGVVYRAHDTHLDRSVAIKVLPAEVVADPERRRRFAQEARSASALNHPNIIQTYDIDTADGADFIAMEYVPGKTLDRLIGPKGLPLDEALKYAIQIADGLAAAHAAGIVHRDLKPANVMITEQGLVKILDFGLAKLVEPASGDDPAVTLTEAALTVEGAIIGTFVYMSPEQAEGKKIDARSDIFSFGSVLYEMVTGRRAFEGTSRIATLSAILHQEPRPVAGVPPELERIIARCLRKDRERRFQHLADVKVALAELREEPEASNAAPPAPPPLRPLRIAELAVGIVLVGALVWAIAARRGAGPSPDNLTFTRLTDAPGPELYPSLSPDGKSFVYQSRASGNWDIYFQRVGGKTAVNLTKDSPADDTEPAFSPDGEKIAFRSERDGGGIFVMGATGESVKRLTDLGHNPEWSPDGRELACATTSFLNPIELFTRAGQLLITNVASGEQRSVAGSDDGHQPNWSPHGQRIAFWARPVGTGQRDLWTVSATGGDPVQVTDDAYTDWDPVWSPDGRYLYFSSDRGGSMNLWRVPVAEETGKVLGPLEPVTTPAPYSGYISFSRDGRRMLYADRSFRANLDRIAFDPAREVVGGQPVPITQGSTASNFPDLSPDGKQVVFQLFGKQEDIAVIGTDGTGVRQLTDDTYKNRRPRWSPDGKQVAFHSNRGGTFQIWAMNSDGSGLHRITDESSGALTATWSPDGAWMAYRRMAGRTSASDQLVLLDPAKSWAEQNREALPVSGPPGGALDTWDWSAEGRRLALNRTLSDGTQSGILTYDLDSRDLRTVVEFGATPRWFKDGRRLLFAGGGKLYVVDSDSRRVREVLSIPPNELEAPSLSGDDRTIVFRISVTEADIWLATRQ